MQLKDFIQSVTQIGNQREAVEYVYNFLGDKYYGDRIKWFTYLSYLWIHADLNKMWHHSGAVQCPNINRLFQHILVESGLFTDKDVKLQRTFIHQYVKLQFADGTHTYVDLRGKKYGIPLGDYSRMYRNKEK